MLLRMFHIETEYFNLFMTAWCPSSVIISESTGTNTIRIKSVMFHMLREVYLFYLLHINADFDDVLLHDIISLLDNEDEVNIHKE